MKRSCWSVGNRGTCPGFFCDVTTPLHAICKVIHTGFGPAARIIFLVTSPTTLMSLFFVCVCVPGGYEIG